MQYHDTKPGYTFFKKYHISWLNVYRVLDTGFELNSKLKSWKDIFVTHNRF